MNDIINLLAVMSMSAGSLLALVAAVGLFRLPDTLARMHAATKPATLGVLLCAVGAGLRLADPSDSAKIVVIVVLQLVSAPIGAHILGRSVRES